MTDETPAPAPDTTPVPMSMHKAVAAFITALVAIAAALGFKTGWVSPDLIDAVSAVVGALVVGVSTWLISNKPKV